MSFKIDYILTLIERYQFLFSSGDYFSRYRLGPLVGYAAGLIYGVDEFLDTYPTE